MSFELARKWKEMVAEQAAQAEQIKALAARVEALEAKRGPGRPKKEDAKVA